MATTRVGIYRKYHGPVPAGPDGSPLSRAEWVKHRVHTWSVRWFGTDGKRYSKSFDTRKEADRFAETKQSEVRENKADPPPKVTLREFYEEHCRVIKGSVAATTLVMQEAVLALLAESVGWDRSMERIASRDIERFRSERLGTGISVASANRDLRMLKRIFNLAVQRGYLRPGGNPCSQIQMVKVGRKRPRYCGPGEFRAICDAAKDPLWLAFLMVVYTSGLRLMEAINLTWSDIDFEVGAVHVTRKTASEYVQAWTPKDKELRRIPLPEQAINLLTAWQPLAPEGCPYVFMELGRWEFFRQAVEEGRWKKGKHLVNNMLRRFKTLCRKAKVGPFTIHDLRRSCITNWAQQLPIHVVQELAGHSDIKTTQQYYLSVRPEDVAKAQAIQAALVKDILPVNATDPKLTQTGKKRVFPGKMPTEVKS